MKKLIFILLITFCYSCSNRVVDREFVSTQVYKKLANRNDLATKESMSYKVLNEQEYKALLNSETVDMPDPVLILIPKGLCPGTRYNLFTANMLCEPVLNHSFIAGKDGELVSLVHGDSFSRFIFTIGSNFMNGESINYLLVSEDRQTALTVTIIPNPIEFRWSDGAYYSLTLMDPAGQIFIRNGYGFKPNEKLYSESTSSHEVLKNHFQADAKGSIVGLLLPAVKNKTGGNATFTIKRESKDAELGQMSYYWGTEIFRHKQVKLKPSI